MSWLEMCYFFPGFTGLDTVEDPSSSIAFFMSQDSDSVSTRRLLSKYFL